MEVTDSQDENEDDRSVGEPEDENELSEETYEEEESSEEEDEDEYDEYDEISVPLRGKSKGKARSRPASTPAGKGKGKAASRISYVAPALAATTDEGSDVDGLLEDLTAPADLVSEDDDHVSMPVPPVAAPVRATPARRRQRAARQPRVWGGRRTRV